MDPRPESSEERYAALSRELLARGAHLPQRALKRRTLNGFKKMCRRVRPSHAVEIGAHEASFSVWLKATLPGTRVVAYEANPYVHERYREEVSAAGVEYLHLAVGPTTGELEMTIPLRNVVRELGRENRQGSMMLNPRNVEVERVRVPAVRLDEHLGLGPDDAVVAWIDVEGANGPVLEGSEAVLGRTALVYIEVETTPLWDGQWMDADVGGFLLDRGFEPVLRDTQGPHQYNVVFARRDLATKPWLRHLVERAYRPAGTP